MAELKTREDESSVDEFLATIDDPARRDDAVAVRRMMEDVTGEPARMWGSSIVGFGRYAYRYESGRSGEWMLVGFSPRKRNLTLYIMSGFRAYDDLMAKLGKHTTGKSCLYLKKLSDVDTEILRRLVAASVAHMREKYSA